MINDQKYLNESFFGIGNNNEDFFIKFDEENFQYLPSGSERIIQFNNMS